MPRLGGAEAIVTAARRLLSGGAVGDESLREASVGNPVPVRARDGALHSWFVPIVLGESLAAFLQLMPDATLMRFSSFQRRPGMREGLPAAADWLDPTRIRERASGAARVGETAAEPMLTFDRNPDRLVWAVTLVSSSGARELYVAGETVYEPPTEGTFG
ncbi:MAG: hypothetical protein H7Y89_12000 [Steroidobacteraceae bacterium]|nr:hypothetical protein [Steroidobacteraceae bacterium]